MRTNDTSSGMHEALIDAMHLTICVLGAVLFGAFVLMAGVFGLFIVADGLSLLGRGLTAASPALRVGLAGFSLALLGMGVAVVGFRTRQKRQRPGFEVIVNKAKL